LTVTAAFATGLRTAQDLDAIGPIQASELGQGIVAGDLTGDGRLTPDDAVLALDIAEGRHAVTARQLRADPNHDGRITSEDAQTILRQLPH
jgi:hypothetical protein